MTMVKEKVNCISPEKAHKMMAEDKNTILLDVRTREEFDGKHIPGALNIPDSEILDKAKKMLPDKDKKLLVYCRSGLRSKEACKVLTEMGYRNVYDFGGILSWPYEIETR